MSYEETDARVARFAEKNRDDIEALAKDLWAINQQITGELGLWRDLYPERRKLWKRLVTELLSDESNQVRIKRVLGAVEPSLEELRRRILDREGAKSG